MKYNVWVFIICYIYRFTTLSLVLNNVDLNPHCSEANSIQWWQLQMIEIWVRLPYLLYCRSDQDRNRAIEAAEKIKTAYERFQKKMEGKLSEVEYIKLHLFPMSLHMLSRMIGRNRSHSIGVNPDKVSDYHKEAPIRICCMKQTEHLGGLGILALPA